MFFTGRDHCLLKSSAQMVKTRQDHDVVLWQFLEVRVESGMI